MAELNRGDRVVDPANPGAIAVVVGGPSIVAGATYYLVLGSDGEEMFYKHDELKKLAVDPDNPVGWLADRPLSDPDAAARHATHLKLTSQLTDIIYSFSSTRTVFRVHQFKPVLKLIDSPVHRLLLADEVGLGKTIEAGLIWAELDARSPQSRVLILCPSGLRRKWQIEMRRRFDREVEIADRARFLELCDLYDERGPASRFAAISSFPQLRHADVLDRLSKRPPLFDLVIVDEAHAMRNPETRTHQLGELLAQNAEALLLLSATPVNLGAQDLFVLLRMLRPEEYDDLRVFQAQLEPNRHINEAARLLRSQLPPPWEEVTNALLGSLQTSQATRIAENPVFADVFRRLQQRVSEPAAIAELHHDVMSLNTLADVYTRTRKRELRDQTAQRRARNREVELTEDEFAVYDAVVKLVSQLRRKVSGVAPALAAIMPARQASSCLPVMRQYLQELVRQRAVTVDWAEGEEDLDDLDGGRGSASLEPADIEVLSDLESLCDRLQGVDTKFDAFASELDALRAEGAGQVLLFSFFRLTLGYLDERLRERGWRTAVMTGQTPMRDRDGIMQRFREGDYDILLCSEIGSEGLDFEFCDVIVNYDLPWNPMRLEQRIGRLDRYGQKSPVIHVVHLSVPGTIDTEIFGRLYDRIGVFQDSIGELEPILGEQLRELNRALASCELTAEEQRKLADDVILAIEQERTSLASFEEARDRLVGIDDFVQDELESARADRRYVTPEELARYVEGFLRDHARPAKLELPDVSAVGALSGSPALADILRRHSAGIGTPAFLSVIANLEAGGALRVTFDSDTSRSSEAEFLTMRHPIVRSIVDYYESDEHFHRGGYAKVPSQSFMGSWIYYVFLLRATGVLARRSLFGIAYEKDTGRIDEGAGSEILRYFAGPDVVRIEERRVPIIDPDEAARAYDALLADVMARRDRQQAELQTRNDALINSRQESLRQGLDARRRRLAELASRPDLNERIRRMRTSQIANLEQRTAADIERLERGRQVTVGFKVVSGGLVDFI